MYRGNFSRMSKDSRIEQETRKSSWVRITSDPNLVL